MQFYSLTVLILAVCGQWILTTQGKSLNDMENAVSRQVKVKATFDNIGDHMIQHMGGDPDKFAVFSREDLRVIPSDLNDTYVLTLQSGEAQTVLDLLTDNTKCQPFGPSKDKPEFFTLDGSPYYCVSYKRSTDHKLIAFPKNDQNGSVVIKKLKVPYPLGEYYLVAHCAQSRYNCTEALIPLMGEIEETVNRYAFDLQQSRIEG